MDSTNNFTKCAWVWRPLRSWWTWVLGASVAACGGTSDASAVPCGTGTVWNGSQCVVKGVEASPSPGANPAAPVEIDLGIRGKAPGPCSIEVKAGPPEKLVAEGTKKTFTYSAEGSLSSMTYRYPDKTAPDGFVEESSTFHFDQKGRISNIRAATGFGLIDSSFAYNATGLVANQTIRVTKSFGSTEQTWAFSYNGTTLTSWLWHDTFDEGSTKAVSLRPGGANKVLVDCEVQSAGALVPGTCWYEQDEKGRVARYVEQSPDNRVAERVFNYDGDRYVGWHDLRDGKRHVGSRINYDAYGNIAYIDWGLEETLPTIERQVYDYACWANKALPSVPDPCAAGGRPHAFAPGTCFVRLSSSSAVY